MPSNGCLIVTVLQSSWTYPHIPIYVVWDKMLERPIFKLRMLIVEHKCWHVIERFIRILPVNVCSKFHPLYGFLHTAFGVSCLPGSFLISHGPTPASFDIQMKRRLSRGWCLIFLYQYTQTHTRTARKRTCWPSVIQNELLQGMCTWQQRKCSSCLPVLVCHVLKDSGENRDNAVLTIRCTRVGQCKFGNMAGSWH